MIDSDDNPIEENTVVNIEYSEENSISEFSSTNVTLKAKTSNDPATLISTAHLTSDIDYKSSTSTESSRSSSCVDITIISDDQVTQEDNRLPHETTTRLKPLSYHLCRGFNSNQLVNSNKYLQTSPKPLYIAQVL